MKLFLLQKAVKLVKKVENYKLKKILRKSTTIYKKMDKNINFDGDDIEKYKFYQDKSPILINNVNINKIVVSNKFSFGKKDFKYFIGYKDA